MGCRVNAELQTSCFFATSSALIEKFLRGAGRVLSAIGKAAIPKDESVPSPFCNFLSPYAFFLRFPPFRYPSFPSFHLVSPLKIEYAFSMLDRFEKPRSSIAAPVFKHIFQPRCTPAQVAVR